MRRVLRGTQGEPAPPRHASSHCCSEPSGCRSAHPNIWPAPSWEAAPFKASLLSIPPKQRGRQSDIDFVLPNYEQLPRPQHRVSPRGGSRRRISRSISLPAGSPPPPLSQQASSPKKPQKYRFNAPSYSRHLPGCSPVLFSTSCHQQLMLHRVFQLSTHA